MAFLFLLTACASEEEVADKKKPLPICPQVAIVRELDWLKDYGAEKPNDAELVSQARMRTLNGDCIFEDEGVRVEFNLIINAKKGPRLGGTRASYPFFVAVVDPDDRILTKDRMTSEFRFPEDQLLAENYESLNVFIPLSKDKRPSIPQYRVLTGFQLTEDQLNVVRSEEGDKINEWSMPKGEKTETVVAPPPVAEPIKKLKKKVKK